ncbi:MAG: hypothetical protein LBR70_02715 [Lactobacillaceae bacterium]|jgi:hypothetical protein|nr:hypothetical protein [Lactobacillaceae bacterium]
MKHNNYGRFWNSLNSVFLFFKEMKHKLYKENKYSVAVNTLRFSLGVLLLVVAVYTGLYIFVFGFILALLVAGFYFIIPPHYLEEDFPVVAEKVKKEVVDFSEKAVEGASNIAHKVKESVTKKDPEKTLSSAKKKAAKVEKEAKKAVSEAKKEVEKAEKKVKEKKK